MLMVLVALVSVAGCGDRNQAQSDAAQAEPPQPTADTVSQREAYTPNIGLPNIPSAPPGTVGDGTVGAKVQVEIKNNKLTLSQSEISPGPASFTFNNSDDAKHIIEIKFVPGGRWRSVPVGKGGYVVMAQSLNAGQYEIYCYVPGHKDKGEKATFVVK